MDEISRRELLKRLGLGAAALTLPTGLLSCASAGKTSGGRTFTGPKPTEFEKPAPWTASRARRKNFPARIRNACILCSAKRAAPEGPKAHPRSGGAKSGSGGRNRAIPRIFCAIWSPCCSTRGSASAEIPGRKLEQRGVLNRRGLYGVPRKGSPSFQSLRQSRDLPDVPPP